MIESFLLIGQSNMAGRGFLGSVPPIVNQSINMLRNGHWQMMVEPIHNDRPSAGVGLASSFAASWLVDHTDDQIQIGLIPCADGGTSLNDWKVGGTLFDNALSQAKLAQRSSQLSGILWHQGENDCSTELAALYCEKFELIINEFREQLQQPNLPVVIGGIGDFLPNGIYGAYFQNYQQVNQSLLEYANSHDNCYFANAHGLTGNEDQLHFDAGSLRKFGLRYYWAFKLQTNIMKPIANEEEQLTNIYNRPLTTKEKSFISENLFASGKITLKEFQERI